MDRNGLDLGALKQLADQQHLEQLALTQAVQAAIANPYRITTLHVVAVAYQPDTGVLMIGQPTGERIDIPLTEQSRVVLRGQLAGEE